MRRMMEAGVTFYVPEIADYEVRRELIRNQERVADPFIQRAGQNEEAEGERFTITFDGKPGLDAAKASLGL